MSVDNSQGVPSTNQSFVDANNRITTPWYRFLISLWRRTGSALGTSNSVNVSSVPGFSNLNLRCIDNASVSISADQVTMGDSSGRIGIFNGIAANFNIRGVGINQMDGSPFGFGTTIYIFLISDGQNVATIGSTSKFFPALPFGYNFKKLVSAIPALDGNSIMSFVQRDRALTYDLPFVEQNVTNVIFIFPLAIFTTIVPPFVIWNFVSSIVNSASGGTGEGYAFFCPNWAVNIFNANTSKYILLFGATPFFFAQLHFIKQGGVNFIQQGTVSRFLMDETSQFGCVPIPDGVSGSAELDMIVTTLGYEIPFI